MVAAFIVCVTALVFFRFFKTADLVTYLVPVGIGVAVWLMVFAGSLYANWVRVPLIAETEALRVRVSGLEAQQADAFAPPASPPDPAKIFLSQSASDILARLKPLRWTERPAVIEAAYLGRWIRGNGTIHNVRELAGGMGFMVSLKNDSVYLFLKHDERHQVEPLDKDDNITYEGQIARIDSDINLEQVTIKRL